MGAPTPLIDGLGAPLFAFHLGRIHARITYRSVGRWTYCTETAIFQEKQMEELPTFTFSILVENRFGVLFNITGLFSARGYNIERLMVVPDTESGLSRITMVAHCGPALADQIVKQLNKQVDVISVEVTEKEKSWPTSTTNSTQTQA